MKKIICLLLLFVAFSIVSFARSSNRSLIVKYNSSEAKGIDETVVKLNFENGKIVSQKTIFEEKEDENLHISFRYGKYLSVSSFGSDDLPKFLDLSDGKFLNYEFVYKTKPEKPDYSRIYSLDRKKYIDLKNDLVVKVDELIIKIEGQADVIIKQRFQITVDPKSSQLPSLPFRWIDNERILTQKENGKLAIVNLDGTIEFFPDLACSKDDFVYFRSTKINKYIYSCGANHFTLDIHNLTFQKINEDLDFGFSTKYTDKRSVYFYQNAEIGKDGIDESTTDGYLALTYGKAGRYGFFDANDINILKVWNSYTKQWQTFTFDGSHLEILGWYVEN